MKIEESYHKFARYYDEYMQHVDYESWVNFVLSHYNQVHEKSAVKIHELACGTGNIATRLVQRGYDVSASDISSSMIDIARSKPFSADFSVKDMRDKLPEKEYDLILLLFDSLNYLYPISEIEAMFDNIHNGLKDDGLFIFDISTEKNCLDNFDGYVDIEDRKGSYLIHRSEYHSGERMQKTHFTLFEEDKEFYRRYDEVHKQKIYPVQEVIEAIEHSNLSLHGIYRLSNSKSLKLVEEEMANADHCFPRLFFVCGR